MTTTPKPGKKPNNDSSVSPTEATLEKGEKVTPLTDAEGFIPDSVEVEDAPEPRQHADGAPHKTPPVSAPHLVSGEAVDTVSLAAIVFKNKFMRKSMGVHHVQRRLVEWGYSEAGADVDGYYGDLTKAAVERFQADQGLEGAGIVNRETLHRLFDNDNNVKVVD